MSTFPWLDANLGAKDGARRTASALRDLRARAGVYYRLGFSQPAAVARLSAAVAWEYEPSKSGGGPHARPTELSDAAITALVAETYARRPA